MTFVDSPVPRDSPGLAGFWDLEPGECHAFLLRAIASAHTYHFERNTAYRSTVAARGIGPWVEPEDVHLLLRTTSLAFKSYVDVLATPFAQDQAAGFVEWLAEHVSLELGQHVRRLRPRYRSLESLLRAVERACAGQGLEMLTSSGASGRVTVVPRNARSADLAVESFSSSFRRHLGLDAGHTSVFMVPKRTRIAMARIAPVAVQRSSQAPGKTHFPVLMGAYPDQVRVRTGRAYRPGWRGAVEKYLSHPVTKALETRIMGPRAVETAVARLLPAAAHDEKILLFGRLESLHEVASFLLDAGRTITLPAGSLLCTYGGGRRTPETAADLRRDLLQAFVLASGDPAPLRDLYGMAEANWAAVQCSHGNYHIPPWVHAITLNDRETPQTMPRSTGLLAFFDPLGGGDLYPAFFRTLDQVTLVRDGACPCGEAGSYLEEASIRRVDTVGDAEHMGTA